MTAISEANALEAALQALNHPPDPTHLAPLSRAVIRAADDLELVAEETANRTTRKKLLIQVAHARKDVAAARKLARQAALTVDRTKLLEGVPEISKNETETDAAKVAREINDSLRRTTAIVSEEVDRSRAAGNVIDESTRRLRMTRNQHGRYGESLSSGAVTLKSIRRSEMVANLLIVLSFAFFFLAAAYVTKQRLANSNISTFVLRPSMKVASLPVRILAWMVRAIGINDLKAVEVDTEKVSSPAQEADEAQRAKDGREVTGSVADYEASVKTDAGERVEETAGLNDQKWSCDADQKCSSSKTEQDGLRNEEETNETDRDSNDPDPEHKQDAIENAKSKDVKKDSGAFKEDDIPEKEDASVEHSQSLDFGDHENEDSSAEIKGGDTRSDSEGQGEPEFDPAEKDTAQATRGVGGAEA